MEKAFAALSDEAVPALDTERVHAIAYLFSQLPANAGLQGLDRMVNTQIEKRGDSFNTNKYAMLTPLHLVNTLVVAYLDLLVP